MRDHVSGQLKVAPEHCSSRVLQKMGKPYISVFNDFAKKYSDYSFSCGREQYLVPYLMSSHPGSTLADAIELALYLKKNHLRPEQVQDFYPTPGTVSTVMFATGIDPLTGSKVYVSRDPEENKKQRALLQFTVPENRAIVRKALRLAGREDLIGFGENHLVPPEKNEQVVRNGKNDNKNVKRERTRKNAHTNDTIKFSGRNGTGRKKSGKNHG